MSIGWRGVESRGRVSKALRDKIEHGSYLLPCHIELVHDFLDAHIFEVFYHGGNGQARILKHPCAADPAGNVFGIIEPDTEAK